MVSPDSVKLEKRIEARPEEFYEILVALKMEVVERATLKIEYKNDQIWR